VINRDGVGSKGLSILNKLCPPLPDHSQWFQVISAYLAGNIAGATSLTAISNINHLICILTLVTQKRPRNLIPASGRVAEKIMIGNARATTDESFTFYMVKGDKRAKAAGTASFHFSDIIMYRHIPYSLLLLNKPLKAEFARIHYIIRIKDTF
jgi:hypothetical protein